MRMTDGMLSVSENSVEESKISGIFLERLSGSELFPDLFRVGIPLHMAGEMGKQWRVAVMELLRRSDSTMPPIREQMFRLTPRKKHILDNELSNIRKRITNHEQFGLYATRARELRKKRDNPGRIRSQKLLQLVQQLKDELPRGRSLERHEERAQIIKKGYERLNKLKQRPAEDVANDETEEIKAIEYDLKVLQDQTPQSNTTANQTQNLLSVTLSSMDCPEPLPITITQGACYSSLVWLLRDLHQVDVPNIWIRQEGKQPWTPKGLGLEQVEYDKMIEEHTLDFVDSTNNRYYIVAVVSENGNEFPVALDIKPMGATRQCCQPNHCGTLRGHLSTIWPTRYVNSAYKRHKPNDDPNAILSRAFDTEDLTLFAHQLCLVCSPRP